MGPLVFLVFALFLVFLVAKRVYVGMNIPGMVPPLSPVQKEILGKYFEFYTTLPPRSKAMFEKKLSHFIHTKTFVPRDMDEVTEEMKVLIGATAVQLTFGLPSVTLKFFQYIIIYPHEFFSPENQRYHYGEVNPKYSAIALSWKNFIKGLIVKDGRNLGLHEMAHALSLENRIVNGEHHFFEAEVMSGWLQEADREIANIQNGDSDFFREYAATNREEFFAVAVENYFERTAQFKAYNPTLYGLLCQLLNQDPILLANNNQQ